MIYLVHGSLRGLALEAPSGQNTRPTAAKHRQAVWNAVLSVFRQGRGKVDLQGLSVCDAFAGSGAMGCEAVSLGAAEVQWIEKDNSALVCLRRNLARVQKELRGKGLEPKMKLWAHEFKDILTQLEPSSLDLLFADPPYQSLHEFASFCKREADQGILKPGGLCVWEESVKVDLMAGMDPQVWALTNLEFLQCKEYGDTKVWFWRKK